MPQTNSPSLETATLGGGCFWCVEAIYQSLTGVEKVISGYSGGNSANPSYEEVSSGTSGHAEVVEISFNPNLISFHDILEVFFHTHDPTTPNRQGADVGSQYRSVIFFHSPEQQAIAKEVKARIEQAKLWNAPIVTEIVPFKAFYPAEEYHQDYFRLNPEQPYCSFVIVPKMQKLYKKFGDKIRK